MIGIVSPRPKLVPIEVHGWRASHRGCGFHETKQGERYNLSEPDRLLAINHQRHAEEVKGGLHDKKGKKAAGGANRKLKPKAESTTLELF